MERLARWGEWFFRHAAHNDRSKGTQLLISGATGCGKSRVAKRLFEAIRVWAVDMSLTPGWRGRFPYVHFMDWAGLAEKDDNDEFEYATKCAAGSQIVIIDDVGSESDRFKSGVNTSRLRRLLSESESKWLLVTTNLQKPDIAKVYDLRVADRLSAANWCDLQDVPSYRPRLRA